MFLKVTCPGCGRELRVPSDSVGRNAACTVCQQLFEVQAESADAGGAGGSFQAASPAGTTASGQLAPHRGGVVLALSIVGWFVCPVVTVIAWLMGRSDLDMMRRGVMDPSGYGITQAGMWVAICQLILLVVSVVLACAIGLVMAIAAIAAN